MFWDIKFKWTKLFKERYKIYKYGHNACFESIGFNVYVLTYVTKLYRAFDWSKYKIWNLKKNEDNSMFWDIKFRWKRLFKISNWQEYKVYISMGIMTMVKLRYRIWCFMI